MSDDNVIDMTVLTLADFSSHVQHPFPLQAGDRRLTLVLEEAVELRPAQGQLPAAFSLIFRGPEAPILAQGTYKFEHPTRGPVDIFIVPVGKDAAGVRYQAIFS